MELSTSFSIDNQSEWVKSHNAEAAEVIDAFQKDKPIRVPLFGNDSYYAHGFYADEINLDYSRYYNDPDEMLRVQLEAARRRREIPIHDFALGKVPESWPVSADFHPVIIPGWVGCEIMYRSDSVPAHHGLNLSKEECRDLEMPDLKTGGIFEKCQTFQAAMRKRCDEGLTFLGSPVGPVGNGITLAGFFSLALDIRGVDIMADMYDDPDFAREFLTKIATWHTELVRCARKETATEHLLSYMVSDHGVDMLSPKMYEQFIVPIIQEITRKRGTLTPTSVSMHHCGRGEHLFPIVKKHFGLTYLNALTFPYVDVARIRREVGEDVWLGASIAGDISQVGPPERIRQTVRDLMESGAKGKGRLMLGVDDMMKGTPLEYRIALYEAVKEFGRY